MSFNIVDLVTGYLGDQLKDQIAGAIGGNAGQTQSALSGAIPGLLSSFLNSGSSQSGAGALFDAVNNQDEGILDNLGDILSSGNHSQLASSGGGILSSLLGNSTLGNITSAVSGLSGLNKGSSSTLIGMLAPVVLGLVKRKLLGSGDLNVGSLMNMFNGQKDNINAAMPAGFNLNNVTNETSQPYASTTREESVARNYETDTGGGSLLKKILPLLLFLGILYLGYNLLFKKDRPIEESAPANATSQMQESTTAQPATMDIQGSLRESLSKVASSLTGIRDVESAKAAIPELTAATDNFDKIAGMTGNMPDGARQGLAKVVSSSIPNIQNLMNNANAIPGVGEILNPSMQKLATSLAQFK